MSDRMTDERLAEILGTSTALWWDVHRELLDALIAERAELGRMRASKERLRVALELESEALDAALRQFEDVSADRDKYRAMAEWLAQRLALHPDSDPKFMLYEKWLQFAEEAVRNDT